MATAAVVTAAVVAAVATAVGEEEEKGGGKVVEEEDEEEAAGCSRRPQCLQVEKCCREDTARMRHFRPLACRSHSGIQRRGHRLVQ